VSLDLAVVGAPFFDLTFERLPRVPAPGEEVVARAVHVAPGGTGMQAIAAVRLGLSTTLVSPIGRRGTAGLLRELLETEGVRVQGPPDGEVPTTALMSTPSGVAMATVLAGEEPSVEDVACIGATAALLSLGRLHLAPPSAAVFAVTGGLELARVDATTLERLSSARALVLNHAEAKALTGRSEPEDAAGALARRVPAAIVTLGADGALAAEEGRVIRVTAPRVVVADATGAGDLFAAAYTWADVRGATLEERLRWACLYAALSVRAPTAHAGALRLHPLLEEGAKRGLAPPPQVSNG
jgi:ribokinase